ncbi:hypothetical protein T11_14058, partial [Trichinella zimbabwensis]
LSFVWPRSCAANRLHVWAARSTTAAEYIWKLRKGLPDSFRKMREKLQTESRRQKKWYDRRTTDCKFNITDKVWQATPKRNKLGRIWEGPYRILQQSGHSIYKIIKE